MESVDRAHTPDDLRKRAWLDGAWLLVPIFVFLLLRIPFVLHAPGQMDEQWFAVPGLTVWREGIPRIPYCPSRHRDTFFQNADRCLFALPPALHYVQAPFFGVFEPGYPTARMPSLLAGLIGLVVLGAWFRKLFEERFVWVTALCMLAISRPWMFTSMTARPDLCCAVCSWLALFMIWQLGSGESVRPASSSGKRHSALAGAMCGLGLLFHPFALVTCIVCALGTLLFEGSLRERTLRFILFSMAASAAMCAWLPLILAYPEEFQSQFLSNVMERSGPGLFERILWPWQYLVLHVRYQWDYNSTPQFLLLVIGASLGALLWLRRQAFGLRYSCVYVHKRHFLLIMGACCYLTATVVGVHPTKGYWIVPIAMAYPLVVQGARMIMYFCPKPILAILLVAIMLPGAGLRTWAGYITHWGEPRVHAGRFIHEVLRDYPQEGLFMADMSYVFDIYLSGRDTVLCQPRERFWKTDSPDFQYLFIAQEGNDFASPTDYQAHFLTRHGESSLPSDCWVEVYTRDPKGGL